MTFILMNDLNSLLNVVIRKPIFWLNIFLFTLIIFLCSLATSHLWHGDLIIHADIARDFLVLDDVVKTHKPFLLGPRSGGVSGIFHGPLWYYVSLPVFILSQGDPMIVGWFWWGLGIAAITLFLFISQKLIKNCTLTLCATLLFSLYILSQVAGVYNPFGAIALSGIFFYFFWQYFQNGRMKDAIFAWFTLGVVLQFQMAFAVPLALVILPVFLRKIWQTKNYAHIFALFFFAIFTLSFILFDVRHDWLQVRSFITYFKQPLSHDFTIYRHLSHRFVSMFFYAENIFLLQKNLMFLLVTGFMLIGAKSADPKVRSLTRLFLYMYIGWWVLTTLFTGEVEGYYYQPFLPLFVLVIMVIAQTKEYLKYLVVALAIISIFWNIKTVSYYPEKFNTSSWLLLHNIALDAFQHKDFGYYLYAQDQFAYPLKFAFLRTAIEQKRGNEVTPFAKQATTILVKGEDNPLNIFSTSSNWQTAKVGIKKEPIEVKKYYGGYSLEVYKLTPEEVKVPSDPNIITTLQFR
jgi:hypothetical protein